MKSNLIIYSGAWFSMRNVEPVKRKHGSPWPEWKWHRFPIKGGITWREALIQDMSRTNPLLKLVSVK